MLPEDMTTLLGTYIYLTRDDAPIGQTYQLQMAVGDNGTMRGTIHVLTGEAEWMFECLEISEGVWETIQTYEHFYYA